MNLIVVVVYWSCLHEESLKEANGNLGKIINCYVAHLLPGMSVVINYKMSDLVLKRSHILLIPLVAFMYGVQCRSKTLERGKPLYWFLTWKGPETYVIYGGLTLVFMCCYIALC